MTIWYILRPLEIFIGHFVYFVAIWYIFPVLIFFTRKKSGRPDIDPKSDQSSQPGTLNHLHVFESEKKSECAALNFAVHSIHCLLKQALFYQIGE
jgi:hypothetical protein